MFISRFIYSYIEHIEMLIDDCTYKELTAWCETNIPDYHSIILAKNYYAFRTSSGGFKHMKSGRWLDVTKEFILKYHDECNK